MRKLFDDLQMITGSATPRRRRGGRGSAGVWRLHVVGSPDPALCGRVLDLGLAGLQLGRVPNAEPSVAIDDPVLSRTHAWLGSSSDGQKLQVRDLGSHNGTWVNGHREAFSVVASPVVVRIGGTVLVAALEPADSGTDEPTPQVPGRSHQAWAIREALREGAASGEPVLLCGETGTGKEHAALALHALSKRRGKLVRVNVAAIPENLFESELFGHIAGSFTGATAARTGRVREAQGGTLVLDEIGDLSMAMQPKLLRLVEEGLVRPVGGSQDVAVDVQFVGSTNGDLAALVQTGQFRRDLLARFRIHVVVLPPLRERQADFLDLADAVVPIESEAKSKRRWRDALSPETIEELLLHAWPDNLRELRSVLLRLRRLAVDPVPILPDELPGSFHARSQLPPASSVVAVPAVTTTHPQAPSRSELLQLLRDARGNVNEIARKTGRHRKQVYRWLDYARISRADLERYRVDGPA